MSVNAWKDIAEMCGKRFRDGRRWLPHTSRIFCHRLAQFECNQRRWPYVLSLEGGPAVESPAITFRGFPMKQCPECNFSFPDSHRVCDFDGTELVPDSNRPSIYGRTRPSRLRRILQSSKFFTGLAVLTLFVVSVFISYLALPTRSIPAVRSQSGPDSVGVRADARSDKTADIKTPDSLRRGDANRSNTLDRTASVHSGQARLRKRAAPDKPPEPSIATRTGDEVKDDDKDPKLVAVLKTTWRVLKKPFRF